MRRLVCLLSSHPGARLSRLAALVFLLIGGCPLQVMDQNAFQTGRVLERGEVLLSGSTIGYYPTRVSADVGLGGGWEVGAGYGYLFNWGWSGDASVIRSLYSSRQLSSSVLFQAELAEGAGRMPLLGRLTTAAAASYWPVDGVGIYLPLRLSMLFAPPATFPYQKRVRDDSTHEIHYETWERTFDGLHDLVFTPGIGIACEYKRFYSRLALNFPVVGPQVELDSVTAGFELLPYLGFRVGVRHF